MVDSIFVTSYTLFQMEWFKIEWFGPYAVDTAQSRKVAENYGIYAICTRKGRASKLLYIGRTYWQEFARRLRQHKRDWLNRISGTKSVYFGIVKLPKGKKISFERIRDIEECLIHFYLPPYNTASKRGYRGRNIIVINTGKYGTLSKIASDDEELLQLLRRCFSKK